MSNNNKSKSFLNGWNRGIKGLKPMTKSNTTADYYEGYAQGLKQFENTQPKLFGFAEGGWVGLDFSVAEERIMSFLIGQHRQEEEEKLQREEAKKAKALAYSKIESCVTNINQRDDWIRERELQNKALYSLRNALLDSTITTRNQVRDIINSYDHREAKAILGGRDTNCKGLRD